MKHSKMWYDFFKRLQLIWLWVAIGDYIWRENEDALAGSVFLIAVLNTCLYFLSQRYHKDRTYGGEIEVYVNDDGAKSFQLSLSVDPWDLDQYKHLDFKVDLVKESQDIPLV